MSLFVAFVWCVVVVVCCLVLCCVSVFLRMIVMVCGIVSCLCLRIVLSYFLRCVCVDMYSCVSPWIGDCVCVLFVYACVWRLYFFCFCLHECVLCLFVFIVFCVVLWFVVCILVYCLDLRFVYLMCLLFVLCLPCYDLYCVYCFGYVWCPMSCVVCFMCLCLI